MSARKVDNSSYSSLIGMGAAKLFRGALSGSSDVTSESVGIDRFSVEQTPDKSLSAKINKPAKTAGKRSPQGTAIFSEDK